MGVRSGRLPTGGETGCEDPQDDAEDDDRGDAARLAKPVELAPCGAPEDAGVTTRATDDRPAAGRGARERVGGPAEDAAGGVGQAPG
jgi:hypothetical protein